MRCLIHRLGFIKTKHYSKKSVELSESLLDPHSQVINLAFKTIESHFKMIKFCSKTINLILEPVGFCFNPTKSTL